MTPVPKNTNSENIIEEYFDSLQYLRPRHFYLHATGLVADAIRMTPPAKLLGTAVAVVVGQGSVSGGAPGGRSLLLLLLPHSNGNEGITRRQGCEIKGDMAVDRGGHGFGCT